jgi:hypothetical protein
MLDYFGRYTHWVAIANSRLINIDDARMSQGVIVSPGDWAGGFLLRSTLGPSPSAPVFTTATSRPRVCQASKTGLKNARMAWRSQMCGGPVTTRH